MYEYNFNRGKKWKDTDMGKKFKLHGHVGSDFTLTSEEEQPQFSKEFEEALRKYVRGYWEEVNKDEWP